MRRKQRKKIHISPVLIIVTGVLIFIFSARIIDKSVRPSAIMQGKNYSKVIAEEIISESVSEYISENKNENYAIVKADENGNITSIEVETDMINNTQSELAEKINSRLKKMGGYEIKIPIGSLTDSYLCSGKGIKIPLRVSFVGETEAKLRSEFTSAGINQTCHRIWAEIKVKMSSAIPLYKFSTENEFEYLISETIIVGKIPDNSMIMKNM